MLSKLRGLMTTQRMTITMMMMMIMRLAVIREATGIRMVMKVEAVFGLVLLMKTPAGTLKALSEMV